MSPSLHRDKGQTLTLHSYILSFSQGEHTHQLQHSVPVMWTECELLQSNLQKQLGWCWGISKLSSSDITIRNLLQVDFPSFFVKSDWNWRQQNFIVWLYLEFPSYLEETQPTNENAATMEKPDQYSHIPQIQHRTKNSSQMPQQPVLM